MPADPSTKRHPIRVAAERAGLTPEVLRAWESRYGVVDPGRTDGGQRRYSDRDVERLRRLRRATDAGRRIGDVAPLSEAELEALIREDAEARVEARPPGVSSDAATALRERALAAARALDPDALRGALSRAVVGLVPAVVLEEIVGPLMRAIGEMWERGEIDPGEEHLASGVVRRVLGEMLDAVTDAGRSGDAPRLLVATPAGQRHEIGALMAAVTAAEEGWRVTWLGADLPAASIASAARRLRPRAVALSVVHPADDRALGRELADLAGALAPGPRILVGGRAAAACAEAIEAAGAVRVEDLDTLRAELGVLAEAAGAGAG